MDTRRVAHALIGDLDLPPLRHSAKTFACIGAGLLAAWLARDATGLSVAGVRALFILVSASALWVTEAIPAFAVGMLIIGLQVALLGLPNSGVAASPSDWEQYARVLGHPLIWLFFGGFVLASGATKCGLDRYLALQVLSRTGVQFDGVLFGVMLITFVLSMFMSNTATTALMVTLVAPIVERNQDRSATGLLLGIAAAANLGGMATLIGTPPNAIAVGGLSEVAGQHISFLGWILLGLPPALVLVTGCFFYLRRRFSPLSQEVDFRLPESARGAVPRWQQAVVVAAFAATLLLWMTGPLHAIPTAAISFVPIVALTMTSVLDSEDIRAFPWEVLFLLAGGLALGVSVKDTGLAEWLVSGVKLGGASVLLLAAALAYLCAALSNFMSNTAAANVLVPIGVTMAVGVESAVAVPLALASSAAMCLPIATPPNALAYATGKVQAKAFLPLGLILLLIAPIIAVLWTQLSLSWVLS